MSNKYMCLEDLQLQLLEDQILGLPTRTGKNKVKVFSIEAGNGKTQTLMSSLQIQYLKDSNNDRNFTKSLVVTPFIEEAERIANQINTGLLLDPDEQLAAYAFHSKKAKGVKIAGLQKYPILVITHKRYQDMRENRQSQPRKYRGDYRLLMKDRTNLIIDEEIPIFPKYQIRVASLENLLYDINQFPSISPTVRSIFNRLVEKIKNKIISVSEKKRTKFRSRYADIVTEQMVQELERIHGSPLDKKDIIRRLYILKLIFSNIGIIGNSSISIVDRKNDLLLLENNIILDASAAINPMYNDAGRFEVVCTERVNKYNNWTLHWFDDNTSKYSKDNKEATYYKQVVPFIKSNIDTNEKALVITSKRDATKLEAQLNNPNISFTNFKMMRGKNDWRSIKKCFILHTPFEPYDFYPLSFSASEKQTLKKRNLQTYSNGRYARYRDVDVQKYVNMDIACSMYQAILRINRNNKGKAEVFIFCNRPQILKILRQQLPGIVVNRQMGY